MDFSLDNHIAKYVFGNTNNLVPFHRSVSCWALTFMFAAAPVAAYRHYSAFQGSGEIFNLYTLLVIAVYIWAIFFAFRWSLNKAISSMHEEEQLRRLSHMSQWVTRLCGGALFGILVALVR